MRQELDSSNTVLFPEEIFGKVSNVLKGLYGHGLRLIFWGRQNQATQRGWLPLLRALPAREPGKRTLVMELASQ